MKALLILVFAYTVEGGLHTVTLEYPTMERCQQVRDSVHRDGNFVRGTKYADTRIRLESLCVPAQ